MLYLVTAEQQPRRVCSENRNNAVPGAVVYPGKQLKKTARTGKAVSGKSKSPERNSPGLPAK